MSTTARTDHPNRSEGRSPAAAPERTPNLRTQVADAIRRHRSGDRAAMTDLALAVTPWLRAVTQRFGLPWFSAEDVAQTTLLALLDHVDRIRDPDAGLGWLAVTARHEAIKVMRVERAADPVADAGADDADLRAPGPEATAMEGLCRDFVWGRLARLPVRGQQILQEIAYGDRPDYSAFSARTGMPVGSIGPTRKRSLIKARAILEPDREWLTCV